MLDTTISKQLKYKTFKTYTFLSLWAVLLILFASPNLCEARKYKDKSVLYQKYPQLNATLTPECVKGVNKMLINFLEYPYDQMQLYSFKNVNDLGSYSRCQNDLGTFSDFAVMNFNLSHLPLVLHFGVCMPKECKQVNVNELNSGVTNLINNVWQTLANTTNVETDYTKNWTQFQVQIIKVNEEMDSQRSQTRAGYIICIVLAVILGFSLCLIPTLIHTKDKMKKEAHKPELQDHLDLSHMSQVRISPEVQNNIYRTMAGVNSMAGTMANPLGNINNTIFSSVDRDEKTKVTKDQMNLSSSNDQNRGATNSVFNMNNVTILKGQDMMSSDPRGDQMQFAHLDKINGSEDLTKQDESLTAQKAIVPVRTIMQSFSFLSAFQDLRQTRRKPWDHYELEMLETFKFVSYVLLQITATAFFLMTGPTRNSWKILDFFQQMIFTVVVSGNIGMEAFTCLSGFFGTYRLMQVYEARESRGEKVVFKDILKFYARKMVRIIPMYYTVFFFGWFVGPMFYDSPLWYSYGQLYLNCDAYWWADLLFIGNVYPFFQEATEGCMFWNWFVSCDVQMYLLIPIYVALYKKSRVASLTLLLLLTLGCCAFSIVTCFQRSLRAGVFALENYYLFGDLLSKPWGKFATCCTGVAFALFYMDVLKYRKVVSVSEKKTNFPFIHYLHLHKWTGILLNILGNFLVIYNLFNGYTAVRDPYSWSMTDNAMYYGFTRVSFAIGIMMVFASAVLGHFRIALVACNHDYMRGLGKLTYLGGLLCPIIIVIAYCSQEYSMYLTVPVVIYLGIGNIISGILCCTFVYLTMEYPLKNLSQILVGKKISHDQILREKWIKDQESIKEQMQLEKKIEAKLKY
eukprot:403343880